MTAFHPGLMFNGEADCVATNLRSGNVQCRGLGRTFARALILTGNPEVISSPVGLVPTNALVVTNSPDPGLSARKLCVVGE